MAERVSLALVLLLCSCAPGVGEGEGEGEGDEGEGEPACELGSLLATSTTLDLSVCLDVASAPSETDLGFHFAVGDAFDLIMTPFQEVATTPATLDASNSSSFGFFVDAGLRWNVATGGIGGVPQGQAALSIDSLDDLEGGVDAVAVPDSDNDSLDSVFLTLRF